MWASLLAINYILATFLRILCASYNVDHIIPDNFFILTLVSGSDIFFEYSNSITRVVVRRTNQTLTRKHDTKYGRKNDMKIVIKVARD